MDPQNEFDEYEGPWVSEHNLGLLFGIPLLVFIQITMPSFIKWLTRMTSSSGGDSQRIKAIVDEIKLMKAAQTEISMMDDFAKYSKIERKIIKRKEELKQIGEFVSANESSALRAFQITFYGIMFLIFAGVLRSYYSTPVLKLSSENWFYPIGFILAFPTGQSGAIGVPFWTFSWRSILQKFLK